MRRILLVKTSSLGDIVHALPAVSDIKSHVSDAKLDWLVEESYRDVPALHPGVDRVITCALRRWRRSMLAARTRDEVRAIRRRVREARYDLVLDLQGLLKTAWLVAAAGGERHGYDRSSIREPLAACFYTARHAVSWALQAVQRNRQLAALALRYRADGAPDYGLALEHAEPSGERKLLFFHGSSRDDKLWPEARWRALLERYAERGAAVVLPWGSPLEAERSRRLARGLPLAEVPDKQPLATLARWCAGAAGVIGVDTGLTHLAAAAGAPVVAIYAGTDPSMTGVVAGRASACNLGGRGSVPEVETVLDAADQLFGPRRP